MDSIPEPIRGKLVAVGYDSLDKLPNNENMDRWNRVQTRCGLEDPELDQLLNIRFPVQEGASKVSKTVTDTSQQTARDLCPFDSSVVSDISLALHALQSPIIRSIQVDQFILVGSGMHDASYFSRTSGEEAVNFVQAFQSFEYRCKSLGSGLNTTYVFSAITCITGMFWMDLAGLVGEGGPLLTYNYNAKDDIGATQARMRPDETIFMNGFLAGKGEHKPCNKDLMSTIAEQTKKLADYNHVEYGPRIVCLPVYSAAGSFVEFGVVDVRTKKYHMASRFNVSNVADRCACFVGAFNFFRFLRTMAPFIPNNPSPIFQADDPKFTFFDNYLLKRVPETHGTCPAALYKLLATGSVPCAAKVVRTGEALRVSPLGVRTPPDGYGLSVAEVRTAIQACLRCLAYLHPRNFVHRDIRWANLIRKYTARVDGSVESVQFILIDFEFASYHGEPMDIQDYIFRDVVPYGEPYNTSHDLFFVGELLVTWAESNQVKLDASALEVVQALQSGKMDAQAALALAWLAL